MSDDSLRRVFTHSRATGNDRLVLLAIAYHADQGEHAPSMDRLAADCRLCRRTVGHRIDALARSGELAVFPQPGKPHRYQVCSGLRITDLKAAFRILAQQRGLAARELRRVRKQFHISARTRGVQPDSQPGVHVDSQPVRKQVHTPAQESYRSVTPKQKKTPAAPRTRPPNRIFEAVAAGSFGLRDSRAMSQQGGRIGRIEKWLRERAPGQTAEDLQRFYAWWAREYPGASAPRDPAKFGEHYLRFLEQGEDVVSSGPLVTRLCDEYGRPTPGAAG